MSGMPRAGMLDSTVPLLRDGYGFIRKRCRRLGSDVFETRLLGQRTICMTGAEAAAVFYDPERMMRTGAMPAPIKKPLLGQGGVQGLDDGEHRRRKALFMDMMTPKRLREMARLTAEGLRTAAREWVDREHVVLLDEAQAVLTRVVCSWAGVPLAPDEVERRRREMDRMVSGSARVGWRHVQALRARRTGDAWAADLIRQVREGRLEVTEGTPLALIAHHRNLDGELLEPQVAGVELLNVLRPTVAVAYYVAFIALALHEHSEARKELEHGGEEAVEAFVQEVRRYYPFFPFVAARVRQPFEWKGFSFEAGRRVMLDLYGTNHDSRLWDAPEAFRPSRFAEREPGEFDLIPQGGGDHEINHRCAGEWITLEIMRTTIRFLTRELEYAVPGQDLRVPVNRFPTWPNSGFVLSPKRLKSEESGPSGSFNHQETGSSHGISR